MDFHNGEMGQDRDHSRYKMELTSVKIKKAEEGEVIELEVVRSEDGDEGTGGEKVQAKVCLINNKIEWFTPRIIVVGASEA